MITPHATRAVSLVCSLLLLVALGSASLTGMASATTDPVDPRPTATPTPTATPDPTADPDIVEGDTDSAGPQPTFTADDNAPLFDQNGAPDPDFTYDEPACGQPHGAQATTIENEAYTSDCLSNDNPQHYWLIVHSKSLGLPVCRSWGTFLGGRCARGSAKGNLLQGENTKTRFNWKDTDGVYVPSGYVLRWSVTGPNVTLGGGCSHCWVKVSPRIESRNKGDHKYFYLKKK